MAVEREKLRTGKSPLALPCCPSGPHPSLLPLTLLCCPSPAALQVAEQLALPPCSREDLPVVLSPAERAFYDTVRKKFAKALEAFKVRNQSLNI